jgi:hypothetical protein
MDGEPPEKKPCVFNREKCIICFKNLATIQKGGHTVITNPIISKELHASFHKSCRAKYTSFSNTYMFDDEATPSERLLPTTDEPARRKTNKRGEKLTSISTGTGQATRQKVLAAADERLDDLVQMRMLTYTDLFAFDAKYHRK